MAFYMCRAHPTAEITPSESSDALSVGGGSLTPQFQPESLGPGLDNSSSPNTPRDTASDTASAVGLSLFRRSSLVGHVLSVVGDDFTAADLKALTKRVRQRTDSAMCQDDIDDIVQDILVDAVKAKQKTGIPVMAAAMTNAARARYYGRRVDKVKASHAEMATASVTPEDDAEAESAVELVSNADDFTEHAAVIDLISRLPEAERFAFVACGLNGMTLAESSSKTSASVSTTHERLSRSKKMLAAAWLAA